MKYLIAVGLYCFSALMNAATINAVSIATNKESVRINCQLNGSYTYRSFTLPNPNRVILDLRGVKQGFKQETRKGTIHTVSKMRVGHPKPEVLRLVFDTTVPMNVTSVSPKGGRGDGPLVLEFEPIIVKKKPAKPLRDVVVALDPGHGGKDPGAFGAQKTPEKKVVLAIAKRLKQAIDKQPGMRAVLTRNGDYYVGLRERLEIARKHHADVFISIHADAFIHPNSKGVSVFALSGRGATSEAARWLAEKENYSELGGVNLADLHDQNDVIRTVLIDLSQTATTTASLQMGSQVLKRLGAVAKLHSKAVEQARFVVLKSPDIPSILVETGFISNPYEEKNLNSPKYQTQLTRAIVEGLKAYFWNHPPHGTHIETKANEKLNFAHSKKAMASPRGHA